MDSSNGNGNPVFNFLNLWESISLDNETLDDKNSALLNNNLTTNVGVIGSKSGFLANEPFLFKKDFKSIFANSCEQNEISSTGTSDKSLSSFGSDSNDSSVEIQSGSSETVMPAMNGFANSNDLLGRQFREASQSPAFFGFSSSNSSSPPLSQTSGPSSGSSFTESVCTNAVKFSNNMISNPPTTSNYVSNNNNSNSNNNNPSMSFNSLSNSKSPFNTKNENCFFNSNPLDNVFDSIISHNRNSSTNDNISDSFSSLLDNSNIGSSDSTFNLDQRRFSSQSQHGLLTNSFSQDSLPHFFQNSFYPFSSSASDNDTLPTMSNSRKLASFNNSNMPINSMTSCTSSLSSPIISTCSLFSSNNFLFNDSVDQRLNNYSSTNIASSNAQMQVRFDAHMRSIANEINSTVQLYLNSIQMRKEQLLKQLDHVKSTYNMLMTQNASKGKLLNQVLFSRITFTRPDQTLFKSVTSFGFINSPAFASYCNATGEGLNFAIEGEPTCFTISTRNCFNEEMLTGGETIDVDIQPADTNAHPNNSFINNTTTLIQKNILDNNNGKYNVTYMIPRGSNFRNVKIFININGLPVNNSPFLATVKTERLRESWKRIAIFGDEGSEAGKFCRPWGIAMSRLPLQRDSNHKIVGDSQQNSTIPIHSKPFYNWNCSSLNKKDYLLTVADRSNNRIQLLKLTITDVPNSSPPGNFMVNNRVEITVLHIFGSGPGTRPGQFDRPAGIAINHNLGQLIVADKDNHRIQVFDLAGNFQFKFGEKGSRAGQFCYPWDIAICPQTSLILVSDTRNRRIQLFTHYGQYMWHCGQPLDSPRGVAFLTPDRFIISDFNKHRLLIIDKNDTSLNSHNNGPNHRDDLINSKYIGFGEGSAWGEFLRPQGLVAVVNKNYATGAAKFVQIMCADSRNNRIAIYNSLNQNFEYINEDASKVENVANVTQTTSGFDRPSGIAIADNILAVVDFGNNRLQIFQKSMN